MALGVGIEEENAEQPLIGGGQSVGDKPQTGRVTGMRLPVRRGERRC